MVRLDWQESCHNLRQEPETIAYNTSIQFVCLALLVIGTAFFPFPLPKHPEYHSTPDLEFWTTMHAKFILYI